jgi:hypothetical protein
MLYVVLGLIYIGAITVVLWHDIGWENLKKMFYSKEGR